MARFDILGVGFGVGQTKLIPSKDVNGGGGSRGGGNVWHVSRAALRPEISPLMLSIAVFRFLISRETITVVFIIVSNVENAVSANPIVSILHMGQNGN